MARKKKVEVVCDRCGAVEYHDEDTPPTPLEVSYPEMDVAIAWEDLCSRCKTSVKNYLEQLCMLKGKGKNKEAKEEEDVEVVLLSDEA